MILCAPVRVSAQNSTKVDLTLASSGLPRWPPASNTIRRELKNWTMLIGPSTDLLVSHLS